MAKILLIEDENSVASFIRKGLTEEGHEITVSTDGASGTMQGATHGYDLILLDIMLPDRNGIDVCRDLRAMNVKTPILFLTALNTPENIAWGLNTGGDDYLAKPFKFIELNARINALLRRNESTSALNDTDVLSLADLRIDDRAKEVTRGASTINLTPTEYRLLHMLVKNKERVLSRMELLEDVWGINFDQGTNNVDVYINYLRKKLESEGGERLIHTVMGMGYVAKQA
ncbi:MAG: response regulator transcription factor [Flavobacteriales bacterium]|nr:response regulator transcription factor [Flavobacteriales bacterium]